MRGQASPCPRRWPSIGIAGAKNHPTDEEHEEIEETDLIITEVYENRGSQQQPNPLTEDTLATHDKHYDRLCSFFSHIQDYESLPIPYREPSV
jgi:hypothetical protein